MMTRREHVMLLVAALGGSLSATSLAGLERRDMEEEVPTFGLIGQIVATPRARAHLAAILAEGTSYNMPGNFLYLVGEDQDNADALWVVELWKDEAAHQASLSLPQVRDAVARARPLIAEFGHRARFHPLVR